jgi:hypothetical protein
MQKKYQLFTYQWHTFIVTIKSADWFLTNHGQRCRYAMSDLFNSYTEPVGQVNLPG